MVDFSKNFFLVFVSIITLSGSSCNNPDDEYKPEAKETPYEMGAKVADFLKNADKIKKVLFFQGAKDANLLDPSDIKFKDFTDMFNKLDEKQQTDFLDFLENDNDNDKEKNLISKYYKQKIRKEDLNTIIADLTKVLNNKEFWKNLSDVQKQDYKDKFAVINKAIQSE